MQRGGVCHSTVEIDYQQPLALQQLPDILRQFNNLLQGRRSFVKIDDRLDDLCTIVLAARIP